MKAVMLSLRPQWAEKIFNGSKTIEVRKSYPFIPTPFKVYVYHTKTRDAGVRWNDWADCLKLPTGEFINAGGKVIGSFVCDRITCCQAYYGESGEKHLTNLFGDEVKSACLTEHEMFDYIVGKDKKEGTGWLWHITEPKLFDKPRDITEFAIYGRCAEDCDEYDICARDSEDGRMSCKYFKRTFLKRPPQSYCFVEIDEK